MRYAVIDIGSNTVKLTIADRGDDGSWVRVVDTGQTTRLGEGIHARRLREGAIRRTLDALSGFLALSRENEVSSIAAVGTSALRDAVNRDEFVARAKEMGLTVEPITGEEEARLGFLAVMRDPVWRDSPRLMVIDIGGGSTEIVVWDGVGSGPARRVSLDLGAVRLTEAALRADPPTIREMDHANEIARESLQVFRAGRAKYEAVGVGGTFVNMAGVKLGLTAPDPDRVHGTLLTTRDVEAQISLYGERTIELRKSIVGLDPARADIILGGAIVLSQVLASAGQDGVRVSSRGMRWGLLYDRFGK